MRAILAFFVAVLLRSCIADETEITIHRLAVTHITCFPLMCLDTKGAGLIVVSASKKGGFSLLTERPRMYFQEYQELP